MIPTTIADALTDLLLRPDLSVDMAIDRHFAPDYRQRTDGTWTTRAQFAEHISHLRAIISGGTVNVREELTDGHLYAERHVIELVKNDGSVARTEVYAFGERAPDGRFARIEETTLLLAGDEADRNLGSAR
jgi:hypothetical protein